MKINKLLLIFGILILIPGVLAGTVTRSFSSTEVGPGGAVDVTLTVSADDDDTMLVLTEIYPSGFTVTDAGGLSTDDAGKLKKIIMGTPSSESYTYTLEAPSTDGDYTFSGTYIMDGSTQKTIAGATQVTVKFDSGCGDDCTENECSGVGYQTCGNYDTDSCNELSSTITSCVDTNECTTDDCSSGSCTHTNVADGIDCTVVVSDDGTCQSGACEADCSGSCTGKECGDDGCGVSCGTCGTDSTCTSNNCVCDVGYILQGATCVLDTQTCGDQDENDDGDRYRNMYDEDCFSSFYVGSDNACSSSSLTAVSFDEADVTASKSIQVRATGGYLKSISFTSNGYFTIDLGEAHSISKATFSFSDELNDVDNYVVLVSEDGTIWNTVAQGITGPSSYLVDTGIFNPTSARYVRLYVRDYTGSNFAVQTSSSTSQYTVFESAFKVYECSCPEGQMICSGTCTDIVSDVDNCGSCGISCGDNALCAVGSCICEPDYIMNNGVCEAVAVGCTMQSGCEADEYCLFDRTCAVMGTGVGSIDCSSCIVGQYCLADGSCANIKIPGDTDCSGAVTNYDVGMLFNILTASGLSADADYADKRAAFYDMLKLYDSTVVDLCLIE
jgi:hypothetical protein